MPSNQINTECFKELKIFLDKYIVSSSHLELSLKTLPGTVKDIARILLTRFRHHTRKLSVEQLAVIDEFLVILEKCLTTILHSKSPSHHTALNIMKQYISHEVFLLISLLNIRKNEHLPDILRMLIFDATKTKEVLSPLWELPIDVQLDFLAMTVSDLLYSPEKEVHDSINYIIKMILTFPDGLNKDQIHKMITVVLDYFMMQVARYGYIDFEILDGEESVLPVLAGFIDDTHSGTQFWGKLMTTKVIYIFICSILRAVGNADGKILLKYFLLHNRNLEAIMTLHECPVVNDLWIQIFDDMVNILFGRSSLILTDADMGRLINNIRMLYPRMFNMPNLKARRYLDNILHDQTRKKPSQLIISRLHQGPTQKNPLWPQRLSIFGDEYDVPIAALSIKDPKERMRYIRKIRTFQKALTAKKEINRRKKTSKENNTLRL